MKFSRQEGDQSDGQEWCLRQAAHPQPHRLANIQQTKSSPFHLWPLLKRHGEKNLFYKILTLSLDLWGSFLSQGRSQLFHGPGLCPIGSNQVGRHSSPVPSFLKHKDTLLHPMRAEVLRELLYPCLSDKHK